MALIAMAVHDTDENKRADYTLQTLRSLQTTVDWTKSRLFVVDNASCDLTKAHVKMFSNWFPITIITNETNIGTAEAINLAWKERKPGEHCIKIDNDVVVHQKGWVEEMEEALRRDETIGQVGLKRKDCIESPYRTDNYKSELYMLPHNAGERWIIAEKVNHVMGTCVMHSSALLDKVGYLYQPKVYGFDDVLMSIRTRLAGLKSVFLPHIEIDHIDTGGTTYQKEKEQIAHESWEEYHKMVRQYHADPKTIYYNPYE